MALKAQVIEAKQTNGITLDHKYSAKQNNQKNEETNHRMGQSIQ